MPNTFLSKLFLIVILYQVILIEGQSDGCDKDTAGELRLRGGTNSAGLVQICMGKKKNGNKEYKWLNVCSDGWGQTETIAVCECQVGLIDDCNLGKLPM